jgi:hypothetical protein
MKLPFWFQSHVFSHWPGSKDSRLSHFGTVQVVVKVESFDMSLFDTVVSVLRVNLQTVCQLFPLY